MSHHIIAVDDDADVLKSIAIALSTDGLSVETMEAPERLLPRLPAGDVLLLDLNFRRGASTNEEGLRLIELVRAKDRDVAIVVITAFAGMATAVEAMKRGADDVIAKPWSNAQIVQKVRTAAELSLARRRNLSGSRNDSSTISHLPFFAVSPALSSILASARRLAATNLSLLVLGETGVGKARLVQEIFAPPQHALTMFANDTNDLANAKPLFVRELGDLDDAAQAHLVALLNQRPCRVVSTSNRTRLALLQRVRPDLMSRISGVEINIPPIRERPDDAVSLLWEAVRRLEAKYDKPSKDIGADALAAARVAPWLGNARAVLQAAERAVVLSTGEEYGIADLALTSDSGKPSFAAPVALVDVEAAAIQRALSESAYNVSLAAKRLGISRAALYRRMEKHGL